MTEKELLEQLENFENLKIRINQEGFHYCFKKYSSWKEINDKDFHKLRKKYLDISEKLEKYIDDKIDFLNEKI